MALFNFVCGVIAGVMLGAVLHVSALDEWQAEAVAVGAAMYCPLDGQFAWKGACEIHPHDRPSCPLGICIPEAAK